MSAKNYRHRGSLSMYPSPSCKKYDDLPIEERVKIAQYRVPGFRPTNVTPSDNGKFTREWWESLSGDEQGAAFWSAMFPHRIDSDFVSRRPVGSIGFYGKVEEWNAWSWYEGCPAHLRSRIEDALRQAPTAEDAKSSNVLYKRVASTWGDRPTLRHEEDIEHFHWLEEWIFEYETQQLIDIVVELAPEIQNERRLLNQAMGLDVEHGKIPSQAEGLDDTQAATVRWLQASGEMPLEFLARTYRSENFKINDRISAARTLMDYVHRKVPLVQKIEQDVNLKEAKLDPGILKGLTEKELAVLETLLTKLNKV